ncbi:unnamed protein product, partial [Mesorhabditis spiculigera]
MSMDSGPVQADALSDAEYSVYTQARSTITVTQAELFSVYELAPTEAMVSMESLAKGFLDEAVDCSFYDPPRSETNVSMLESLDADLETALDNSVYEVLPSETAVSMDKYALNAYATNPSDCDTLSDHGDWSFYEMPDSEALVEMSAAVPTATEGYSIWVCSSETEIDMRGRYTPVPLSIKAKGKNKKGLYVNKA